MERPEAKAGCRILVAQCARLQAHETALVVSDPHTQPLGEMLAAAAGGVAGHVEHCVVPALSMHGQEPPPDVARRMQSVAVVFGLTRMSMAHSAARLNASRRGVRYLSLPDYSWQVLASPALRIDFESLVDEADWLAEQFTAAEQVRITSPLGSDLICDLRGRAGNSAPGVCRTPGSLASPPDAESNVPPVETGSRGTLVVDGSVPCPQIGLLDSPLTLTVEQGRVTSIRGRQAATVAELFDAPADPRTRVVAEFGIGLNPAARLCGSMLEDEGCRGTCHLGIGSNLTIGGRNDTSFHLDFVVRNVSVELDGTPIMKDGCILSGVKA